MRPSIDAVLAAIALQEFDKIKAMGEVPGSEAMRIRLDARRDEHSLILETCEAFMAGGAR